MTEARIPEASFLVRCIDLDAETGLMTWRTREASTFLNTVEKQRESQAARFNTRWAGTPAFACLGPNGYLEGRLNRQHFYAHRVIWKILHNEEPPFLDHENGDRTDNRPSNLRAASILDNNRNRAMDRRNRTGATGVHFIEKTGRYDVRIGVGNRTLYVGSFESFEAASAARKQADLWHQFHRNHGRSA